ncbi:glutathione S-transferase N-terminal domain-containing protein [Agrobacterium larrymoorei]|uniref:glutathione S-transferase N-terminal domain-containing protein n=1 Tax=Agrobacterium larrymoorei TaxID=160699 RepID=UPI0027D76C49|nr:glutathione S-transferase family protein [Agrobacterium larrymoorei]
MLVALYENGTSFESVIVDFSNSDSRAAFFETSPMGTIPVSHDAEFNVTMPESGIIIEYINTHYPGHSDLCHKRPTAPGAALGSFFRPLHPPADAAHFRGMLTSRRLFRPAWRVRGTCDHRHGLRRS